MIGVLYLPDEAAAVDEFFQLFKTPWEPYVAARTYDVVISTVASVPQTDARLRLVFRSGPCSMDAEWGLRPEVSRRGAVLDVGGRRLPIYGEALTFEETSEARSCVLLDGRAAGVSREDGSNGHKTLRLGYDLFKEVQHLLSRGQPLEHATVPTLDLHIDLLRQWILKAELSLVEVPPFPAGSSFIVCLTHDIDFIGIRYHRCDHTMWGFLMRATVGAFGRFLRGRIDLRRLVQSWSAAASLPLVYLGWQKDFWLPFTWYLEVEKGLAATYYLIPFKGRPGDKVPSRHPGRRATAYDVSDLSGSGWIQRLQKAGCEIGVHGIDAWHDVEKGKAERLQTSSVAGESKVGIRVHWLLSDADTVRVIEEAGYDYNATAGYNETPGYRAGTSQVYRPGEARRLLELPLHIQDGALFYPQRLDLPETEAWDLCTAFINHVRARGGVLTILWHDRSHGPERFWGDFYARLVNALRKFDPWFGTAGEVVEWFRARRCITFERCPASDGTERVVARCRGTKPVRPFVLRVHNRTAVESACTQTDVPWAGQPDVDVSALIQSEPVRAVP